MTRNLFHQGRFSRDISLNVKYLIALKYMHNKNQLAYYDRQVYPENSTGIYENKIDSTRKTHGYLLLDFAQDTDDHLQFRIDIFPGVEGATRSCRL